MQRGWILARTWGWKGRKVYRYWFLVWAALLLAGCAGVSPDRNAPSTLDPRGPGALQIANLWWVMFALGTAIYLGVMGLALVALLRRRREGAETGAAGPERLVVWGGLVFPTLVIIVVYTLTLGTLRALSKGVALDPVVIEVVGRRWWWEVHYPQQQIASANEIVIPAGRPVQLLLTSQEVIHSFWVPQLHGKMDLNPGRVNTLWIEADQPGEYWGECAEFCGIQHAKMQFVVIALPPDEFNAWLQAQQQPAAAPAGEQAQRGEQVFLSTGCINCHTVRGTHATGELGPDLTHFAGRRTLASGVYPNVRGNLAGWIVDPQGMKPGALMPPTDLSAADLNALLVYLETLK